MKSTFLIMLLLLLYGNQALAYIDPNIDPNTGRFIFQLLYPVFAAIGIGYFFLKSQIKQLFMGFLNLIRKAFGK